MTPPGRYWQKLALKQRTGAHVFSQLFQPQSTAGSFDRDQDATSVSEIAVLLESPASVEDSQSEPGLARYSLCAGAPICLSGKPQLVIPKVGEILTTLRELVTRGPRCSPRIAPDSPDQPDETLPFLGGWFGWFGYDLAWEIEQLPSQNSETLPFPVAFWYEPACFAVLDHWTQHLWLSAPSADQLNDLQARLDRPRVERSPVPHHLCELALSCNQAEYESAVRQAKDYIRAGDVFQVNLSLRFHTETTADPWQVYRNLQQINPSPFASYWQTPWGTILSCSPERLVQSDGQTAQTRPIAGTRPRGQSLDQDQALATELRENIKEQAEHIMLVDLERNDLGRVCQWGTVKANELLVIERYSHVMHLVSNVVGRLQPDATAVDLIEAMFPGGTITGCPKVRCMEIIEELEATRRNLFYGSCGYLDARGSLDLNILIRTLLMSQPLIAPFPVRTVWGQVGAGIVADSDPQREWLETLQKSKAQLLALALE